MYASRLLGEVLIPQCHIIGVELYMRAAHSIMLKGKQSGTQMHLYAIKKISFPLKF